mgnify:CR=1 FL=1
MMTIKTRSASKAEKGTTRLSPNGKTKDIFAEKNKKIEESDTVLNVEGMLKKVKEEKYPPLLQQYKDNELTDEEFKRGVDELHSTMVKMAEDTQSIANKVDELSLIHISEPTRLV